MGSYPLRADRGALDRVSHIVLGRRVPLQTASLFVVRDRLIAAEDAVADVTVVDRACLNHQFPGPRDGEAGAAGSPLPN